MENLRQALMEADEAYLIGMSNKGTYKRALKDLEGAEVSVNETDECAEVHFGGEVCKIKAPLWESSCSCPSRSVCRHLISAILWLKNNSGESETTEEETPIEISLPDTLKDAMKAITPEAVKKSMGSQLKKMLPIIDKIKLEESSILSGTLPDGTAVRILYPLEGSTCSCHSKELCAHKSAVILAWQIQEKLVSAEDFQEKAQQLSAKDADAIRECAMQNLQLLHEVFQWGLVRMPENIPDHLEAGAVRCHSLKMADAERQLRELGSMLESARGRRAVFRIPAFLRAFCEAFRHLSTLTGETITEESLGQFRSTYEEESNDLHLLPVGERRISGDYEGTIYYFLDIVGKRFLTISDLRPTFYDTVNVRKYTRITAWNTATPIHTLMRSQLTLKNAKINGGKLSTSKETLLVAQKQANLDCPELRSMIFTDFRKLAIWLDNQNPTTETERLCFVSPSACEKTFFDEHSQKLNMILVDKEGNRVNVQVRYRAETKGFIEQLERIGKMMDETPDTNYTWLCSAYFEEGKLMLFPIELYDFIHIPESAPYQMPENFSWKNISHAPTISELLRNAENWLCSVMQTGLQSANPDERTLKQAEQCGMQGLHDLMQKLTDEIISYRHTVNPDPTKAIQNMAYLQQYLTIGRQKIEVRSALVKMNERG